MIHRNLCSANVLVRNAAAPENVRGVLGNYTIAETPEFAAPETRRHPPLYTVCNTLIFHLKTYK